MQKTLKPLSLTGFFILTIFLGGAEGGCDDTIGDGDGDGDTVGDGDGDTGDGDGDIGDGDGDIGDGDGDISCQSDTDCGENQLCAVPDCAAICEIDPANPDECTYNCSDEGTCIDINPGPCAVVDCAPGYRCEVEPICTEIACAEDNPDCNTCEDQAICLPDNVTPDECYADADCDDGFVCIGYDIVLPCFDENDDNICDDGEPNGGDGLVAPGGYCEPWGGQDSCDLVDCGPGYVCEDQYYCTFPCEAGDVECEDTCAPDPICIPVGNDECWNIPVDSCSDVPGCRLEEYSACTEPSPDPTDPNNPDGEPSPIPPNCDVELVCVPDYNEPPEGSCEDSCGNVGSSGQCFCDNLCEQYGDCCQDFVEYCEEVLPPGCNSDEMCGDGYICEQSEFCYDDLGNGQECFVEGYCVPVEPVDPCNDLPIELCEEVQGCSILEIAMPCSIGPAGNEICPDGIELICVSEVPEPPNGCVAADGTDSCGPDGQCVTETICYDICDQTVPDPECCFEESYCVYVDTPVCIQVETPATNPVTGNCVVFPTPCDVPQGWIEGCDAGGGSMP